MAKSFSSARDKLFRHDHDDSTRPYKIIFQQQR